MNQVDVSLLKLLSVLALLVLGGVAGYLTGYALEKSIHAARVGDDSGCDEGMNH